MSSLPLLDPIPPPGILTIMASSSRREGSNVIAVSQLAMVGREEVGRRAEFSGGFVDPETDGVVAVVHALRWAMDRCPRRFRCLAVRVYTTDVRAARLAMSAKGASPRKAEEWATGQARFLVSGIHDCQVVAVQGSFDQVSDADRRELIEVGYWLARNHHHPDSPVGLGPATNQRPVDEEDATRSRRIGWAAYPMPKPLGILL